MSFCLNLQNLVFVPRLFGEVKTLKLEEHTDGVSSTPLSQTAACHSRVSTPVQVPFTSIKHV